MDVIAISNFLLGIILLGAGVAVWSFKGKGKWYIRGIWFFMLLIWIFLVFIALTQDLPVITY